MRLDLRDRRLGPLDVGGRDLGVLVALQDDLIFGVEIPERDRKKIAGEYALRHQHDRTGQKPSIGAKTHLVSLAS